jgi:hypothetical protein
LRKQSYNDHSLLLNLRFTHFVALLLFLTAVYVYDTGEYDSTGQRKQRRKEVKALHSLNGYDSTRKFDPFRAFGGPFSSAFYIGRMVLE